MGAEGRNATRQRIDFLARQRDGIKAGGSMYSDEYIAWAPRASCIALLNLNGVNNRAVVITKLL